MELKALFRTVQSLAHRNKVYLKLTNEGTQVYVFTKERKKHEEIAYEIEDALQKMKIFLEKEWEKINKNTI